MPLHGLLQKTAKAYPEKSAIIYFDKIITYEELDQLSDRFAAGLLGLGVGKGDRVAIFLPNIPQFIIAYYGILKSGAVLTAISPLYREREVEYQLADSEAQIIVTLDSLYPLVAGLWAKTKLKHVIVTTADEFTKNPSFPQVLKENRNLHSFQEILNENASEFPKTQIVTTDDLAALQYTGGTTGTAKAAMLTHANLVSNAIAFSSWIKCSVAAETFLVALPLFHIYGMTTSLNVPVAVAGTMVLLSRFEPKKALAAIWQHRISVFCGVPTMYQTLVDSPEISNYDLTSIRVCISGASPLPPEVQKRFMQVTGGLLAEGYGLTEASPVTHCNPVDKTLQTVKVGSIGLPLPDTEARIVDAETGTKTLGIGETGELSVKGPQVMKGYWHQPCDTAQILRDGWLLTGDLAHMDAEGYFYITDRKKDLIKYKGCSVYPRELEDIFYEHSSVKLCAVVGKPDPLAGEIPKAFVVLKEEATVSAKELSEFVNIKVAPYKAIRELEFRKDLPLSSAGKVLRRSLREESLKRIL